MLPWVFHMSRHDHCPGTRLSCMAMLLFLLAACAGEEASLANPLSGSAALSEPERNLERLAVKAKEEGDLAGAAEFYRQMAGHSKGSVVAHLALADIHRHLRQPTQAAAILREGLEHQPQHPELLTELGFALIRAQKPREALVPLEQAIQLQPSSGAAFNGKGVALDMQETHEQAQDAYRQALAVAPDDLAIQNNLALSLILSEHYDEAITLLEPLAAKAESRPTVRQNLALAYGLKGDSARAMALGLKDLSQAQAKENLKFYAFYHQQRAAGQAAVSAAPVQPVEAKPGRGEDDQRFSAASALNLLSPSAGEAKMSRTEAAKTEQRMSPRPVIEY